MAKRVCGLRFANAAQAQYAVTIGLVPFSHIIVFTVFFG